MKRRSALWLWLQVSVLAMGVSFCTPQTPAGGPGSDCEITSDCDTTQDLECRAKKCRTKLDQKPPTARFVVIPEAAEVGQKLQLDGRSSKDPQETPLTYKWSIEARPAESQSKIENADQAVASFVPDKPGKYTFKLEVAAGEGDAARTHSATNALNVTDRPNTNPIANAGPDQLVTPNSKVELDGSKSTDPEGAALIYQWTFKSKPEKSLARFADATLKQPSFVAEEIGDYVVELVVTDERGAKSSPDSVSIRVLEGATSKPVLTGVTPNEGLAYELKYAIAIKGEEFFKGARVRIASQEFPTEYVSQTELKAELNLALIGQGVHDLAIVNPNGLASTTLPFTIKEVPPPKLSSLSPARGHIGNKMKIIATGENFIADRSEVLFQAVPLPTKVLSPTEVEFEVDLNNTPIGKYPVKVSNPGNRASNELTFEVLDRLPKPILRVLNPPSGEAGFKLAFSVHGQSFSADAVIVFDGKEIPSKRIRSDEIQADPELDLSGIKSGEYDVWVRNSDGLISNKEVFRVRDKDPTPALSRMLPFNLYLDEVMIDVAVYGQDFVSGAKLFIDGKEITGALGKVVFRSDTFLLAEINLTDRNVWKNSGNFDAIVENPSGKKSAPFQVTVTYRVPSVNSLIPGGWSTRCDTDVEVHGSNFVNTVQVKFGAITYKIGDATYPLTFVNDKLLTFPLPATKLAAGKYKIIVENGPQATATYPDFEITTSSTLTPYPQYVRPAVGNADTTVTVVIRPDFNVPGGSNSFKAGSIVELNGKKQATTCLSFSPDYCYEISAELDLTGLKPGNYDLEVVNPCDVRGAPMTFSVEPAPKPYITGFKPSFAQIGHKTKIAITGANFSKNHTLTWGGKVLATTHVSDTEIETVDPIDFSTATLGDIDVQVKNANGQATGITKFSVIGKYNPTITEVIPNVQERGRILSDFMIKGSGFALTSRATIGGVAVSLKFISTTEVRITGYDATNVQEGSYAIQIINGSRGSNLMPFQLTPIPSPRIDYINPSSIIAGTMTTATMYIYGSDYSTTPDSTVLLTAPDGKDLTNLWTVGFSSANYIRGTIAVAGLAPGQYTLQVKNPNGELSNKIVLRLSPPPPPEAISLNPATVFRGGTAQRIQIVGNNFITGDILIFDNNPLNRIPGTSTTSKTLEGTFDLSRLNRSGKYDIYVLRCLDANCTNSHKTKTLQLTINDPPCSLVDCAKDLPKVEKCDAVDMVCRPPCTTTADCTTLDSKATWTCQSGICK